MNVVQQWSGSAAWGSTSVVPVSGVTAGNLLLALFKNYDGRTGPDYLAPTDNAGGAWGVVANPSTGSDISPAIGLYYKFALGGESTISRAPGAGASQWEVFELSGVGEFVGMDKAAPLQVVGTGPVIAFAAAGDGYYGGDCTTWSGFSGMTALIPNNINLTNNGWALAYGVFQDGIATASFSYTNGEVSTYLAVFKVAEGRQRMRLMLTPW